MKTRLFSFLLLLCLAYKAYTTVLYGQSRKEIADTIRTKRFSAVDITAQRIGTGSARLSASTTALSAEAIKTLGARQIADALSFMPGVFVRNYGGLSGLKTVSLRGASASQTAVLLDGVRLQSTQSGQFDFSTMPASMLEEIEVVRGGGAAVFGGNAMGGAVNIRTKSSASRAEAQAEAEAASFQEFRGALSGALPFDLFGNGRGGIFAGAEYQSARGNYPFPFNDFGQNVTLERMNADFRNLAANALIAAQSSRFSLQARCMARSGERGTPGAVVQGNVEMARARLGEDDVLVSLRMAYIPAEQVLFTLLASGKWNTLHYLDPDARQFGANGIDERFRAQDYSISGRLRFDESTNTPDVQVSHEWLVEQNTSTLRGNMLQRDVGTFVERTNTAFAGKGDITWKAFGTRFAANAAVRLDFYSDVGTALSPLAGGAWILDSAWAFRAEWSYNFRPPSFNELYYLNFGNSQLKPERANCFSLGTSWKTQQTIYGEILYGLFRLDASVDGFYHRTENQILAVQTSPFTVSAQNIADAQSYGIETSLQAVLEDDRQQAATLTLNYTYQRATNETPSSFVRGKQLIYTPEHCASGVLALKRSISPDIRLNAGLTAQFAGERFYLPSNATESVLPAFVIVGAFAEMAFMIGSTQATARLQGDNLLDERYAVIRNFPMPGRSVRASLRVVLR